LSIFLGTSEEDKDQKGEGGLTIKLECRLIHRIMEDFFTKHPTEEPNHGTLAYFIIRYRYRGIDRLPRVK
jgi:hypothetical protein